MILSLLLGIAVVQGDQGDQEEPYVEPPSLYQAIVERPTGKNGYEDYLIGIDRFREAGGGKIVAAVEAGESNLTFLEGERLLATKFARVLSSVRAGNAKPIANPRSTVEADTYFPELRWIKPGVRVFRAEAYVRFAAGDAAGGLGSLFDAALFVSNMQGNGPLAFYQAGVDPLKELITDIAVQLRRSSLVELVAVERWATVRLAGRNALLSSLDLERVFIQETMDGLATGNWRNRRGVDRSLLKQLDAMKIPDRLAAQVGVNEAVVDSVKRWHEVLAFPEARWQMPDHPVYSVWGSRMVEPLNAAMSIAAEKLAVERTRLRLLVLSSRVLQYRWENERLPEKLSLVSPSELLVDPLNGKPFEYQTLGADEFRVSSLGPKGGEPVYLENPAKPVTADNPKKK